MNITPSQTTPTLVEHSLQGRYEDRPEPWQTEYICDDRGAELWFTEEDGAA